jgi:hypothetical protein
MPLSSSMNAAVSDVLLVFNPIGLAERTYKATKRASSKGLLDRLRFGYDLRSGYEVSRCLNIEFVLCVRETIGKPIL